jgi:general secretion pathway protein D
MTRYIIALLLSAVTLSQTVYAKLDSNELLAEKVTKRTAKKRRNADIYFDFKDEDLIDIINKIASLKNVNIVLPSGANAINVKINLSLSNPLTLDEAWDILYKLLDIAGYSLIQKKDLYIIVKNGPNISRESLPIFINVPFNELPKTDERIVYIYYLSNIKASQEFDNQLGALFKELLPPDALYKADKNANGILLVAKSQDIRSIMEIVEAMDQTGFQERLEMIRLRYTTADTVARIFNDGILKTAAATPNNRFRAGPQVDSAAATYFSQNVRVIPEPRTNSLLVLGRVQAVERIKDFIFKYIDTQLDSGKSILHIYELQYLDADEFAPVLQRIIDSSRTGGTGQSTAGEGAQSGTERFFDQVIIRPDSPPSASEEGAEGKYFGGNKLVIAARNDDWNRIRILIETLDKPQPQVIIEVLIADLTLDDTRRLGAITRNPSDIPFPGNASFQSAMTDQLILDAPSNEPDQINLLRGVDSDLNAITSQNPAPPPDFISVPQTLPAGTAVLSLSDSNGRTWSILQILKQFDNTKILSHPHIIATNNQTATIEVGETRLIEDQAAPSTSGITIRKKELRANTNLKITPRISSANTVNLQVIVDIDQFSDPTNFASGNRFNRDLVTNASVKSGDILALGGLIRDATEDNILETPGLSSIPIFGWFFKQKAKTIAKTSLNIFITPTIIQPKLRGGVGEYTRAYAQTAKDYTHKASLFDNLRDPITRWFFLTENDSASVIDEFLEKDASPLNDHQLINIEYEEDILDNPESYTKSGQLKALLEVEQNPLLEQRTSSVNTKSNITTQPSCIPAKTIAQVKPAQKKSAIIPPPAAPAPKRQSQPVKGGLMNISSKPKIPCPVKKTTTQTPKTKGATPEQKNDLKNLLAQESNPLIANPVVTNAVKEN